MGKSVTDRLRDLIADEHEIPAHVKRKLLQAAGVAAPRPKGGWVDMLSTLRKDKRSIETNMHNRSEAMHAVYAEYLAIMSKVRERMQIAQAHGTPADAERAAALVNEARALEGKRPLGTNGKSWQSWVPPHIREQLAAKVTQAYDNANYKRGNRFIPFIPTAARKSAKTVASNLTAALGRIRRDHESAPNSGRGYTLYRALHLAAARMAERELHRRLKAMEAGVENPVDNPLPVNWLALLDAPMRARLRDAQKNPAGVSLEGLDQFHDPAPEQVRGDMMADDATSAQQAQEIPDEEI